MNNIILYIETIRRYIINAQIEKAFEELLGLTQKHFQERRNEVIILNSDYNSLKRKEQLGIGEFNKERNRVNLAILSILDELEGRMPDPSVEETAVDNGQLLEKIDLLEKNMGILLDLHYNQVNGYYLSFRNSRLWNDLEEESRNIFHGIYIAEREKNLDNYSYVIDALKEILLIEFRDKLFSPFRRACGAEIPSQPVKGFRKAVIKSLRGNCSNVFYKFIYSGDFNITFNQMIDILYENILLVDSREERKKLLGWGEKFFDYFSEGFKIKNQPSTVKDFDYIKELEYTRRPQYFVFTDFEAGRFKNTILNILIGIQLKAHHRHLLRKNQKDRKE